METQSQMRATHLPISFTIGRPPHVDPLSFSDEKAVCFRREQSKEFK